MAEINIFDRALKIIARDHAEVFLKLAFPNDLFFRTAVLAKKHKRGEDKLGRNAGKCRTITS